MREELLAAVLLCLGGLMLLFGVYLSYLSRGAYALLAVGVCVFCLGLHFDQRRSAG